MKSLLIIEAQKSPEFLERLLRVCRHRGFTVDSINAETANIKQSTHVTLTVCSDRDISLLTKQIEKIVGVTQVATLQQEQNIKATA
ncbi:acetolactate synthase 2 small subunit [Psychromonas sp. RZ22]|uniref:acetolactate synthase 2 small subunit n=1 Tax=Psychromonas algarum TaxID=2555643 RepID=UPI00106898B6|nr:acetolactate synthase 2 small subunit [Psychromonas sp. RZ22]TEW56606.1 acetolactate synthase 2 small subunit [Psychromonas sp. RZ22]